MRICGKDLNVLALRPSGKLYPVGVYFLVDAHILVAHLAPQNTISLNRSITFSNHVKAFKNLLLRCIVPDRPYGIIRLYNQCFQIYVVRTYCYKGWMCSIMWTKMCIHIHPPTQ